MVHCTSEEEGIDTAILLADSFDHRFTPMTLDIPRVRINKFQNLG